MCGIIAVVGDIPEIDLQPLLDRIAHRGPDGQGLHRANGGEALLAHRRLAIIDPEGGRQPLVSPEDGTSLVHNGMIYNYTALRAELAEAGRFTCGSDSESILQAVRQRGPEAVTALDGMFAFVSIDAGGRVIAARDPVGIKPLYWGRLKQGGQRVFASEIKALDGVARDVREFPAGHVYDGATGRLEPFYQVPDHRPDLGDVETTARALRETIEAAVVKRLRSDVPLGAFLSGGLDSSIIAAVARQHVEELHTFAVGLEGSSDIAAARRVAEHLGTTHHEYLIPREEILEALPQVLYHLESHDRELVRSAIPCWMVSRLAAERVKVVLTGEGADELFAGYRYYADFTEPAALHAELRRSVAGLHNVNLQRVDRMTMAHGLEARVPFLDTSVIDLALRIDPALKVPTIDGRRVEKWILRKAFEDLLPEDLVWRVKEQFDEGSGMAGFMQAAAERFGRRGGGCAETAWYRDLLAAGFADPEEVLGLVAPWRGSLAA